MLFARSSLKRSCAGPTPYQQRRARQVNCGRALQTRPWAGKNGGEV